MEVFRVTWWLLFVITIIYYLFSASTQPSNHLPNTNFSGHNKFTEDSTADLSQGNFAVTTYNQRSIVLSVGFRQTQRSSRNIWHAPNWPWPVIWSTLVRGDARRQFARARRDSQGRSRPLKQLMISLNKLALASSSRLEMLPACSSLNGTKARWLPVYPVLWGVINDHSSCHDAAAVPRLD